MKTALLVMLAAGAGCANILDIPNRIDAANARCEGTIKIKILYDGSGATADVGIPFFKGQKDLIREINNTGGIRGCQIEYEAVDYMYVPSLAQTAYNTWKAAADWDEVVAIMGWGSSDSLLLAPQVRDDKKPFISASYFGGLAAPQPVTRDVNVPELSPQSFQEISFPQRFTSDGFGYNFFAGTDYSTGARIAMFHVAAQGGKRVGFFYCSTSDYCKGAIPAARTYAKNQNLLLGRDLSVELTDTQATYDAKVMQYFNEEKNRRMTDPSYTQIVDWVWGGNTTKTSAYLAKSIAAMNAALGLDVHVIINNWGFDENLFTACGTACVEKVHGIMPFVAYGDTRAGAMGDVTALHDKWRNLDQAIDGNVTYKNVRYVQGYVNILLLKLAVEKVITSGKSVVNGDNIKAAFETGFKGVDTGGLTGGRLTFSPTDHRPQSSESIYKFSPAGTLVLDSQRTITMDDQWLGW